MATFAKVTTAPFVTTCGTTTPLKTLYINIDKVVSMTVESSSYCAMDCGLYTEITLEGDNDPLNVMEGPADIINRAIHA